MAGATALNSFFSPRQPAIDVNSNVLQLLLAPCGVFWAKWVPKWGVTLFGKRIALNLDAPVSDCFEQRSVLTVTLVVLQGMRSPGYLLRLTLS